MAGGSGGGGETLSQSPPSKAQFVFMHIGSSQYPSPIQEVGQPGAHSSAHIRSHTISNLYPLSVLYYCLFYLAREDCHNKV